MSILVDKERAVKANFKNITFFDMVVEAVSNAIDANAQNIAINISSLDNIIIEDDGDGFTDDNFNSFLKLYSPYKKAKGAKGLGRLAYLKFYRDVVFDSVYKKEDLYFKRGFIFNYSEDEKATNESVSEEKTGTRINFNSWLASTQEKSKLNMDTLKDDLKNFIYSRMLPSLLLWKETKVGEQLQIIIIDSTEGESIISTKELPKLEIINFTYTYKPQESELLGIQKEIPFKIMYTDFLDKNKVSVHYVSAGRIIKDIPLHININSSFTCFYASDVFDNQIDDDRLELKLPSQNTIDSPSKETIEDLFYDHLIPILETKQINLNEIKNECISSIQNNYPEYTYYIDDITNKDILSKKPYDIVKKAHDSAFKKNKEFIELKQKVHEGKAEFKESDANELFILGASALAGYIQKRQEIIDTMISLYQEKSSNEDTIHNLLLKKMGASIPPLSKDDANYVKRNIEINNLWLIDDKYMSFNYAFSDQTMKKIFKEINEDETDTGEPDIAIFSNYPESDTELQAVIIEIKSFRESNTQSGRTYKFEGIRQLRDRARIIHENHPSIKRSCYYLITSIDDGIRRDLLSDDFTRVYSHGNEFWFSHQEIGFLDDTKPKYKLPIYVLNIETLTKDAHERNKVFLDILKMYHNL